MPDSVELPPGQVLIADMPTIDTVRPPRINRADWEFTLSDKEEVLRRWDWAAVQTLPTERFTTDLHCVAGWSVIDTRWTGVPVRALLATVAVTAGYAMIHSYGGYTTNLPLEDLLEMPTWLVFELDDQPLAPEQGGPARLLVPHLYLFKSVKWACGITLSDQDQPGWHERHGYHNYGDPWRQQRFSAD